MRAERRSPPRSAPASRSGPRRWRTGVVLAVIASVALAALAIVLTYLYLNALANRRAALVRLAERRAAAVTAILERTGDRDLTLAVLRDETVRRAQAAMDEEIVIGAREGERLVYLLQTHGLGSEAPPSVPWDSPFGGSLKRALAGRTGVGMDIDYAGVPVLAAYLPIAGTSWALAAKLDLRAVRAPFYRAIGLSLAGVALLAIGGATLVRRLTEPLIERIERSEQRFQVLARHSSDAVLLLDAGGGMRWASAAVAGVLGYVPAALEDASFFDFVHPGDEAAVRQGLAQLREAPGEPLRLDLRFRHFAGNWLWLEAIASNQLADPEIAAIVVNARDVSARHEAEERVRSLNRVLRASAEIGDAVLRSPDERTLLEQACRIAVETGGFMLAWVGWKDPRGTGRVQPAAIFGASRSYVESIAVSCDDTPLGQGPTGRAIRLGQPSVATDFDSDAMEPWREALVGIGARCSAALPVRVGFEIVGALSVYSDQHGVFDADHLQLLGELAENLGRGIHLHRVRAEKDRIAGELARSNEDLQQFAHVASHDLQEPLRMVVSYLDLLERRLGPALGGEHRRFLDFAVEGGRRMQELVEDLLSLSRIGTPSRPPEPVELDRVLDQVIANLGVAIRESGAVVERGELPVVRGDASQLAQLLQNLVANAIKFRSEAPPRIRVSAEADGETWRVSVADNGIGVPAQHRERIFEVFQRLHRRDEYPGTGIGLTICRRIAARHGGRIWIEPAPGGGSLFFVTLPAAHEVALAH